MENQNSVIGSETTFDLTNWLNRAMKRLFDITVSFFALVLLSPFLALIAVAIKRDSPGPVFYRGSRMGMGGKSFKILKFRTMYETPASYAGAKVTVQDDDRITALGHWLRNTKINEVPQFWNVLKGEMSLVGPRPEDPDIAMTWPRDAWKEVLSVRPGITSPASVQYRNEEALLASGGLTQYFDEVSPDKIRLDQLYVRHHSLLMDLDTLFWTFIFVLPLISMNCPPESLLFVGPFTRFVSRYLNWYIIDLVVSFFVIGFTGVLWRTAGPLDVGLLPSLLNAAFFSVVFTLIGAVLGVNRVTWAKATFKDGLDLIPAWVIAATLVFFANTFARVYPSKMILTASVMALAAFFIVRFRGQLLTNLIQWNMYRKAPPLASRERVIIVGTGAVAQQAAWMLGHPDYARRFWVVGFVDEDMFKQDTRVYGYPVIGMLKDIPTVVRKYDVGLIILADYRMRVSDCHPVINMCNKTGARLLVLPDFYPAFNLLLNNKMRNVDPEEHSLNEMNCIQCMTKYGMKNTGSLQRRTGDD